ncbi:MAG: nuclear transport factor 2 family protein [Algoriphagus aquaeductus]|uniref:nuclear transport factor 2 family protein n=1 Tax=Algoriphagus aquaeductus TaxID=475299 RepID=UPI00387A76B6
MEPLAREKLIRSYLDGYNQMNIEGMMEPLDEHVVFENYSSGQKIHSLQGKEPFLKQAREALAYFSSRKQNIKSILHLEEETEVEISYWAIAAMDFPNGILKGQEISLEGKSVFRFAAEKISSITDYSQRVKKNFPIV